MKKWLKQIIEKLENQSISGLNIFLIILCSVVLRNILENISSPLPGYTFFPWHTSLYYTLFYLASFPVILITIHVVSKVELNKVFNLCVYGFPIITIPPIIDLLTTKGSGACIGYIFSTGSRLFYEYITLAHINPFISPTSCGLTFGIRIEVCIILFFVGFYIYKKTKSLIKSVCGISIVYTILFFYGAPGIIETVYEFMYNKFYINYVEFFIHIFSHTLLQNVHTYTQSNYTARLYEHFSLFFIRIHLIESVIGLIIYSYIASKEKYTALLKDLHISRILYYMVLALFGIFLGKGFLGFNLPDTLGYIVFFGILGINFIVAQLINDIADQKSDRINKNNTPLVTEILTQKEYITLSIIGFFIVVIGALSINKNTLILMVLMQIISILYSCKPFRLKRNFITGGISIGLVSTLAIISGYFVVSSNQAISSFPLGICILSFIFLFSTSHIRDFKDTLGDKEDNIHTLPVVMGYRNAQFIVAISVGLQILIGAILFYTISTILATITLFSGVLFVWFILRKKVLEIPIFLVLYTMIPIIIWFLK